MGRLHGFLKNFNFKRHPLFNYCIFRTRSKDLRIFFNLSVYSQPASSSFFLVTNALRGFSAKRDARLANNDDKVLSGKTAEQCADACEKENSFPCRSFDYDRNGTTCYLSREASGDVGLTPVKGFDYYQMSELLYYVLLSKHV